MKMTMYASMSLVILFIQLIICNPIEDENMGSKIDSTSKMSSFSQCMQQCTAEHFVTKNSSQGTEIIVSQHDDATSKRSVNKTPPGTKRNGVGNMPSPVCKMEYEDVPLCVEGNCVTLRFITSKFCSVPMQK